LWPAFPLVRFYHSLVTTCDCRCQPKVHFTYSQRGQRYSKKGESRE
jgi:hypothetical protein